MEKVTSTRQTRGNRWVDLIKLRIVLAGLLGIGASFYYFGVFVAQRSTVSVHKDHDDLQYGLFPQPNDPFQFIPCTSATTPPPLDDRDHRATWAALFDHNPDHWSWGDTHAPSDLNTSSQCIRDPYADKGIYLCGYIDVPLDYTNCSDSRKARLAVTKYQVSGLAHKSQTNTSRGKKSARTLIIQPGGPGGSGTSFVWRGGENQSQRLSSGELDVLGWDPRGVNISQPSAACFPYDADRDRWALLTRQSRASVASSPRTQLDLADAMNNAIFAACKKTLGDLPRFLGTAFVARDLEQIRIALDEPGVTGYFVSYGTGIGQTYANMFPERVGNLILDGTEYVRDHRLLGGFGYTALDNATDAWNDGFLGECISAGPQHCALISEQDEGGEHALDRLKARMTALLESIRQLPRPAFTDYSGPSLVTYSELIDGIYSAMYNAVTWPALAKGLENLERGNTSMVARMLEGLEWEFDPTTPCGKRVGVKPSSTELTALVICADSYDDPEPSSHPEGLGGLDWWSSLWHNMTSQNWIAGDSRFYTVLPCRRYTEHFGAAAEVYRGDLNHTLSNPLLLIAETYDPATPLRNGRRLAKEMGESARLIVHHGYGHSSRDSSMCTNTISKNYILHGTLPGDPETACYADEKPYRYGIGVQSETTSKGLDEEEMLQTWWREMSDVLALRPGRGWH